MGVKNAKTKQARRDAKKTQKAVEQCPFCRKKMVDLEDHIEREHGCICERCGLRFRNETQWKQHMRDRHGLNEQSAATDDAKKKIERWVHATKKGAKKGRNKNGRDVPLNSALMPIADSGMGDDDAKLTLPTDSRGFQHLCESCGAVSFLPVCLTASGLSFTCAHAGKQCSSGQTRQPAVAATGGFVQPQISQPQQISLFGTGVAAAGAGGSACAVAVVTATACNPISAPVFGAPVPVPTSYASAETPSIFLPGCIGGTSDIVAANVPIPSDDEDL